MSGSESRLPIGSRIILCRPTIRSSSRTTTMCLISPKNSILAGVMLISEEPGLRTEATRGLVPYPQRHQRLAGFPFLRLLRVAGLVRGCLSRVGRIGPGVGVLLGRGAVHRLGRLAAELFGVEVVDERAHASQDASLDLFVPGHRRVPLEYSLEHQEHLFEVLCAQLLRGVFY